MGSYAAELPEIISGKKAGRTDSSQRIVAGLIGMGSLDLSVAAEVFEKITESPENVLHISMSK
jgi:ornithine cyclodeaminase/alanine dehydrogenase-like protein (mu-crystallin family)